MIKQLVLILTYICITFAGKLPTKNINIAFIKGDHDDCTTISGLSNSYKVDDVPQTYILCACNDGYVLNDR